MERRKDNTIYCVRCKTNFIRKPDPIDPDYIEYVPKDEIETKKTIESKEERREDISMEDTQDTKKNDYKEPTLSTNKTRTDKASALLGQYLLKGWTLLQEHCPQCIVPLMRNPQGTMVCVLCNSNVVKDNTASQSPKNINNSDVDTKIEDNYSYINRKRPLNSQNIHEQPKQDSITVSKDNIQKIHDKQINNSISNNKKNNNDKTNSSINDNYNTEDNVVLLNEIINGLYNKMHSAKEQLLVTKDIKKSHDLCVLIADCGNTLLVLNKLKKRN